MATVSAKYSFVPALTYGKLQALSLWYGIVIRLYEHALLSPTSCNDNAITP